MKEVWRILGIGAVVITLALSMSPGKLAAADKVFEFKISVDTVPNHPRNMGLVIFIEELEKKSGGKLKPKYYHSAQLYKDAHVTKALRTGTVEMAVPGNWVLEGFDTSTSLTMLPMFFGQPEKVTENLIECEGYHLFRLLSQDLLRHFIEGDDLLFKIDGNQSIRH